MRCRDEVSQLGLLLSWGLRRCPDDRGGGATGIHDSDTLSGGSIDNGGQCSLGATLVISYLISEAFTGRYFGDQVYPQNSRNVVGVIRRRSSEKGLFRGYLSPCRMTSDTPPGVKEEDFYLAG